MIVNTQFHQKKSCKMRRDLHRFTSRTDDLYDLYDLHDLFPLHDLDLPGRVDSLLICMI